MSYRYIESSLGHLIVNLENNTETPWFDTFKEAFACFIECGDVLPDDATMANGDRDCGEDFDDIEKFRYEHLEDLL